LTDVTLALLTLLIMGMMYQALCSSQALIAALVNLSIKVFTEKPNSTILLTNFTGKRHSSCTRKMVAVGDQTPIQKGA